MPAQKQLIADRDFTLKPFDKTSMLQASTPQCFAAMNRQFLPKLLLSMAVIALTLTLCSARVNASTTAKTFEFGPGTDSPTSSQDSVTLSVPARTVVKVSGALNPVSGLPVMVVIQIFRPQGGPAAASLTLPTAPGVSVPIIFPVEMLTGITSQVGCPSAWRVRVSTQNGNVPGTGVSGSITFDYERPGTISLDMVGDTISVNANANKTRNLSGHGTLGIANGTLIAGTGEFRIRAKWDNLPAGLFEDGYPLRVRLLKPNGAEADTETGRPQNYNGDSRQVDFWYTVTPADALLTGPWKIRVFNTVGSPRRNIWSFDIENFAFPGFNSTFQAQCN